DPSAGTFVAVRNTGPISVLFVRSEAPNELWVGTQQRGLLLFDMATGDLRSFPVDPADSSALSHRYVSAITTRPDDDGGLWVGTLAGGLHRLDLAAGRFRRFTRRSSPLPTNTVYALEADDAGELWLATNRGLVRFDPDSGRVQVYDVDRGVQSRQFNPGASYRTPRGELAFGGIDGFNLFRPADVRDSPYAPRVAITDVRVQGRSLLPALGALPDAAVPLVLPYDANDLTFAFVGLHFARPERNRYAVRLEGYEDDWREIGA